MDPAFVSLTHLGMQHRDPVLEVLEAMAGALRAIEDGMRLPLVYLEEDHQRMGSLQYLTPMSGKKSRFDWIEIGIWARKKEVLLVTRSIIHSALTQTSSNRKTWNWRVAL